MLNSENNSIGIQGICANCKKDFSTNVQFYYDSNSYGYNYEKFASCKCPFCGTEDYSSIPFLFMDYNNNILYMVFSTFQFNEFEHLKFLTDKMLEQYLKQLPFKEQAKIKNAERKYIEKALFKNTLSGIDNENFIIGQRRIRFTPPPQITIDKKYCFLCEGKKYNLSKNDIGFNSNGLSQIQSDIITEARDKLQNSGFTVNFVEIEDEKSPQ